MTVPKMFCALMHRQDIANSNCCLRPARVILLLFLSACCVLGCAETGATKSMSRHPFPAQFGDPLIFSTAIAAAQQPVVPRRLSGITVPHHMVAADLIARGFQIVDADRIDKVIVLFPDHFRKSRLPFATTRRAFETVFGRVEVSEP